MSVGGDLIRAALRMAEAVEREVEGDWNLCTAAEMELVWAAESYTEVYGDD